METFRVEGIVLRTDDFGDANKVVTLFTREFGKLEANAYGCRRARSPLSGALMMFNHISAELTRGAKVDVIREAEIINFYDALTGDLERLAYASFFFEVVNRLTLPQEKDVKTFHLLRNSLPALSSRKPKIAALISACQFMENSGVQLSFNRCVLCGTQISGDAVINLSEGGAICPECSKSARGSRDYPAGLRRTFNLMRNFDWRAETKLFFNSAQVAAAWNLFVDYLRHVLGSDLNSLRFIRDLELIK